MTTTAPPALTEGPAMTRIAGLPAAAIEPLAASAVAKLLAGIARVRGELAALGPAVSDLLHQAVPRMSAPATRRTVLAWRRAAHAAKPVAVEPALLAEVRSHLAGTDTSALDRWTRHAAALTALRTALRTGADQAAAQEERALRELLSTPALANALAVVSPVFSRQARRSGAERLGRGERLTAYRYAVRGALKTSPLSSLTELAWGRHDGRARARVSVHPLILRVLLHAAAWREGVRDRLHWRVNGSLRTDDGQAWLTEPQLHTGDGFAWSGEETIDVRERTDLLRPWPDPLLLPERRLARHLDSGLVAVDDPCPQEDLLAWLTSCLSAAADPQARRAGEHLHSAAAALAALGTGDARTRARELTRLRAGLTDALRELGAADGWPVTAVPAVYEDRAATVDPPPLAPAHRAALRRYARTACDSLEVSPAYRAMVEEFVTRFGAGGVCRDVYGFCRDLMRTGWPYTVDAAAQAASTARPGRSSCRPCVAVLCQATEEGPDRRPVVVVNHLSSGTGGLLARFHRLFDGTGGLADRLRDWLRTLYPGAELLEVVPAREANPLQADSSGVLPALHWPTAPRPFGPGVDVTDLRLVHDPVRDALELRRPDGAVVAPVYLGTVPQHLIGDTTRPLVVLSDPWSVPTDLADAAVPGAGVTAGSTHLSRRSVAEVVVRRATWRVDATSVPRRARGEQLAEFLERMDDWRRACELPPEVYVRAEAGLPREDDRIRKPVWLALASPTGVEALAHLAARAGQRRLVFTECLPRRTGHGSDPGAHAAEHALHFVRTAPE